VATSGPNLCQHTYGLAPLGGVERPGRVVRFARLIQRPVRAFWRAFGPRRLRRQSEPALVATQGGTAVPLAMNVRLWCQRCGADNASVGDRRRHVDRTTGGSGPSARAAGTFGPSWDSQSRASCRQRITST
jgi:hypothetical protein